MTRAVFGTATMGLIVVLAATAGVARVTTQSASADKRTRGEYLVRYGGCNDCHTPFTMGPKGPEPDMSRMLSGHPSDLKMPAAPGPAGPWLWHGAGTNTAFAGPWGVSYAINLTSHATGLGNWTEQMFVSAMRTGQHTGRGRPILPPMPWQSINSLTDADLKAVFAYLRTVPPIDNVVPPAQVAAPPASR